MENSVKYARELGTQEGILGGISTGQDIVVRFAVKPTSSILTPRRTIDAHGREIDLITKGRHDPCVGIRAVPVAEATVARIGAWMSGLWDAPTGPASAGGGHVPA